MTTTKPTKKSNAPISLYNYLTKQVEPFTPITDVVGLYTCGPTVYDTAHIGNLRTYIFDDLLRRTLEYFGLGVKQVMNLTDVDDKTIRGASEKQIQLKEYTAPFIELFYRDLAALNIQPAAVYPRATEHIPEMIKLIQRLEEKGLTYVADGSVYFAIRKLPGYGKLSGVSTRELKAGARVDVDVYDKEAAEDFVLWKAVKPADEQVGAVWDSPWGKGRPGWHIECSAMSMKYLGETFDLHAGAIDLLFPHHEDEIAQSEGATGKPFAKFFLEGEHLLVDNRKMAKSDKNFFTLRDIEEKGIDPLAFRYLMLTAHYRSKINFTWESLEAAAKALQGLRDSQHREDRPIKPEVVDTIDQYLANDLDLPKAVALLHEENNPALWRHYEPVLGLGLVEQQSNIPQQVQELLTAREEARQAGDYARADQVRKQIELQGWAIEDTPTGSRLIPKAK